MDNPMPAPAKPASAKAKLVTLVIIGLLFIGVPSVLYVINRNNPVDPNASKVTIDYYRAGVKTNIPESSSLFASLKSNAELSVSFAENYSPTAGTSTEAELAKNMEAIEVSYGSMQSTSFLNSNFSSVSYTRVLLVPAPDRSSVQIIFGADAYTSRQAVYTGSGATAMFDDARSYTQTVNQ